MKRNIKFFTIVISLLLISSVLLTGCMLAIAADKGGTKPYDLKVQKNDQNSAVADGDKAPAKPDNNVIVEDDTPTSQESLQAKFDAMYDISEAEKSITVISKDYLNDYWQSNYEKEDIKSLTTEEVYYIIQDSIRIYAEYDAVILTGFASFLAKIQVVERFPAVSDDVIITTATKNKYFTYSEDDILNIHKIIMYRLTALSSPKAFFTGAEAISFNGGNSDIDSSWLPKTTFYIPGYCESTDRDYLLSAIGERNNYTDLSSFCDLFIMTPFARPIIEFSSKNSGTTQVYPTKELEEDTYPYFHITVPELDNAVIEHREDSKIYVGGAYLCGGAGNGCMQFILNDLTLDGKPEMCFVMAVGSGMVDFRIAIYDYETRNCIFSLSDRGNHDYGLFMRDGVLCVSERKYMSLELTRTGVLTYDASGIAVSWDDEVNYPGKLPTGTPFPTIVPSDTDTRETDVITGTTETDIITHTTETVDLPETTGTDIISETTMNSVAENGKPYLKYDANDNYCSLMSENGSSVFDGGSYEKDDDKLVFMFKTSNGIYQYYFAYHGENLYEYVKEKSSPMPLYEFDAETKFVLYTFDNCSSCILEVKND